LYDSPLKNTAVESRELTTRAVTVARESIGRLNAESIDTVSLTASGGITSASIATGSIIGDNAYVTADITSGSIHTGPISATTITSSGDVLIKGNLVVIGTSSGPIIADSIDVTGNITSGSLNTGAIVATSENVSGLITGRNLDLTATSNQLVTSSNSSFPTTLSVPTFGQTTTLTVPDPGVASSSFILANGAQTINGAITFATAPTLSSIPNGLTLMSNSGTVGPVFPNMVDLPLSTSSWQRIYGTMLSTNNTLYTVPTGNYAILMAASLAGASTNSLYALAPDSNSYLVSTNISTGTGTVLNTNSFIFLPGDTIVLNCSGTPTLTMSILTYPVSGAILKPLLYRSASPATGSPITVYNCPSGIRSSISSGWPAFNTDSSVIHVSADSGTTGTVTCDVVISSASYLFTTSTPIVLPAVYTGGPLSIFMNNPDSITVTLSNTWTNMQVWATISEFPSSIFV